jgi:uncharacterized lipoprotein YddW (UPF0748 family)
MLIAFILALIVAIVFLLTKMHQRTVSESSKTTQASTVSSETSLSTEPEPSVEEVKDPEPEPTSVDRETTSVSVKETTTPEHKPSEPVEEIKASSGPTKLPAKKGAYEPIEVPKEVRGVWFSYHEWEDAPKSESEFKAYADEVMTNLTELHMNTIYVHVRADSDAMYPSDIFPWSKYITGTQGEDPGFDPFLCMVNAAHDHGIRIHAWINPYRVTHKDCAWEDVCADNPARIWYFSGERGNDRLVLLHDGQYYYNPAKEETRKLIEDGVKEILEHYNVDGIHLDDYFYPTLNDGDKSLSFDYPDYLSSGTELSVTEYRRENVNILVRELYSIVKEYDENIEFGISPAGNLDNLYSDRQYFTDVEKWMSEEGYIDYIIPQLFWGFEIKTKDKKAAPWAYKANLSRWNKLSRREDVALYIGLPMYLAGTDTFDNNNTSEWLRHDDIISRMVTTARKQSKATGFVFYAYSSFFKETSEKEVENLLKILK